MKNQNKDNDDPLSIFGMDLSYKGLSWAEQFYQIPSRYVGTFKEQFQKACMEVDDWLNPLSDEIFESLVFTSSVKNKALSEVNEMPKPKSDEIIMPIMKETDSPAKRLANILETRFPVSQGVDQKSNYVGAFRDFTDVDDSFKLISAESMESPGSSLVNVQEMSEPTFKAIEPTMNEAEHKLVANVIPEIGATSEEENISVSCKVDGYSLSLDSSSSSSSSSKHAYIEGSNNFLSSTPNHDVAGRLYGVHMVNQDDHLLDSKPSLREIEVEERNLPSNMAPEDGDLLVDTHTFVSSKGDKCALSFDPPQPAHFKELILGLRELEITNQVCLGSNGRHDEHSINVKPSFNGMELEENNNTNMGVQDYGPDMEKGACVSSNDDECNRPFAMLEYLCSKEAPDNVPEPGLLEHESFTEVCAALNGDQVEHSLTVKPIMSDLDPDSKWFSTIPALEMPKINVPLHDRIHVYPSAHGCCLSVDVHHCSCIKQASNTPGCSIPSPLIEDGENHDAVSSTSMCATNKLIPIYPDNAACEPFIEKYDAIVRRDCHASPAAEDGASNGHVDRLDLMGRKDSPATIPIKLEEFVDVELGDSWDDLDFEEVSILSQRKKTTLSYKKKLKNSLRSISWPSRKKSSSWEAILANSELLSSQMNTKTDLPGESDWEFV